MGVSRESFELLQSLLPANSQGLRMFELGNQHLNLAVRGSKVLKDWARSMGIDHVSVDWNGKDGALARDVCSDLSDLGEFDIVTNFGSSEHVYDQEKCFRQFHERCKTNGLMVHAVPLCGHWPKHSPFHHTQAFFAALAKSNLYSTDKLYVEKAAGPRKHLVVAVFLKLTDNPFVWVPEELAPKKR